MATINNNIPVRRSGSNMNIGKKPTASQKLINVSNKIGLPGIAEQQGSSVNIMDTVPLVTNAQRTTLTFFTNTTGKSRNFANFSSTLKAGESLVLEEIAFLLVVATTADLTSDANAILSVVPIMQSSATAFPNKDAFALGLLNIIIGNTGVVKDYCGYEQLGSFNPSATGLTVIDTATATNRVVGASKIKLEAAPTLPPNLIPKITYDFAPTGTVPAFTFVTCIAGRFGSIYSAKTTL
jgi:hypothetical protein